ncbi:hypothetical protein CES85_3678 (plasmid) [Ochrobactrum quorumnocens]|uniref:Uncharacterized protein n=1 Tax=Ochrobactrum quorumnocens TaxID=271865 RepID=A0A248UPB6_9HYPH|nr:hypothetical protein [[Ochrobactrum] quorumnocens]ASV88693.1 hypothetical protein CES85_3678 [[Ochrobactrum] quorumnocens]
MSDPIDTKIAVFEDWRGQFICPRNLITEAAPDVIKKLEWRKPIDPPDAAPGETMRHGRTNDRVF